MVLAVSTLGEVGEGLLGAEKEPMTSGPFVLKRSLSFTFSNPVYLGPGQTTKTFDDAVLNNGQSYAYEAFERTLTDTLYFYHADHLGTPIAVTNTSGALLWRAEHTPFGGIYALTVGTITNNLRFPGQYYDSETGLAQNWFRDYRTVLGRYWEADPLITAYPSIAPVILSSRGRIGVPDPSGSDSSNSYGYSNPVSSVDPLGLFHYKPGTQMANPDVEAILDCMDKCLGRDLGISAGTDKFGHGLCPPFFSQHYIGEAADISKRMNPGLKPKDVMCCAKKCGAGFAQTESDHYHIQAPVGKGGSHGQMPSCGCDPPKK
jgi:RHS repeat-associated protein